MELFVRKNNDDKIYKEFYYLEHMTASGNACEFIIDNTEKSAVEIAWILDVSENEAEDAKWLTRDELDSVK